VVPFHPPVPRPANSTAIVSALRAQAAKIRADAERHAGAIEAQADALQSATTVVTPKPLTPFGKAAAEHIDIHPGLTGEEISEAIGCAFDTFRGKLSPRLAEHGYHSRRWGGGGYFGPRCADTPT
jgi:hypothetical protein